MEEISMVESPIVESPILEESSTMVVSPTMVESPIIVESPVIVESPTIVESPMQKRAKDKLHKIKEGLEEFEANLTDDSNRDFQSEIDVHMNEPDIPLPLPSTILEEYDKVLLHQFCNKIAKLQHSECPTCNECFPSITLVVGECCHCYTEKTLPKKFSFGNNMDPGEVPEELQGLTELKRCLLHKFFL
ncbi:14991_t:CDS:2 [Gigaspora margarita]|uniref:14991_t:CDS:1 n=1 Tax=Gigaspora margarita TaxID=4874 RepID=A0ABN7VQ76_GIGMA|nr:14991_t:CDS:2 [Gigaspora margarita]